MQEKRQHRDRRITGNALYEAVRSVGKAVGLPKVWPHGFRHSAITTALDRTNGNVRAVQQFSRHRDVRVVERYDDNRQNLAADVARLVAG